MKLLMHLNRIYKCDSRRLIKNFDLKLAEKDCKAGIFLTLQNGLLYLINILYVILATVDFIFHITFLFLLPISAISSVKEDNSGCTGIYKIVTKAYIQGSKLLPSIKYEQTSIALNL